MDLGDIQFRIGLIIAVIVLGSTFATGVYLLVDRTEEGDAEATARTIGRAIEALPPGSGRATLRIEFRSGAGEGIRIDPKLSGDHFTIHVLPSLVYIRWAGGREIVSELRGIVPSYLPFSDNILPAPLSDLGEVCEGFEVRTPCTLFVDQIGMNGSVHSFVHPPSEDWMANVTDLSGYLSSDRVPPPGGHTRHMIDPEGPVKVRGRWISFTDREGSCPYPVWVPPSWDMALPEGSAAGRITAEVRCSMVLGGLTISRTVG
jgi:hypothetical protein